MYNDLIKRGIALEDAGNVAGARELYIDATKICPARVDAWDLLGDLHWNVQDFLAASGYYKNAFSKTPDDLEIMATYALSMAFCEKRSEAIVEMERYLIERPNDRTVWYNYGVSLRRVGRVPDAIAALQTTMDLDRVFNP